MGRNRSLFPHNMWCLTCNKPESMLQVAFYGDWNYCHCPRSFSLGNFAKPRRDYTMWQIHARTTLQEADEKEKVAEIVGSLVFTVSAADFGNAVDAALELLPDSYSLYSVTEISPE